MPFSHKSILLWYPRQIKEADPSVPSHTCSSDPHRIIKHPILNMTRLSAPGGSSEPRVSLERHDTHLTRTSTRRTLERYETRPTQDASDVLDLPYDILSDEADMREYIQETTTGVIPKRTFSRVSGKIEDHELITFKVNDPENPKNWSKPYST